MVRSLVGSPETNHFVTYCFRGNLTYDKKGMIDFCCTGLCVDLLKKMAHRMDFNYEMYEVGDQKWGIQNNVSTTFLIEPRREKTGLRDFRPGPTQTGLYKLRKELEA